MVNISEAIKLGENLFTSGDLDNALIIFQNILESNPEQYEAMNNIGTIYYLKEDISTAESYYLNSYSINNDYNDVLLNLTDLYINDKKWDRALPFLEKYITKNSDDVNRINQLATIKMELGSTIEAIELLKQSLDIKPEQHSIKDILKMLKTSVSEAMQASHNQTFISKFDKSFKHRFSVCMIEPEGRKHAHFLHDLGKYVCFTFECAGYECCIVKNRVFSDRVNIIIGGHHVDSTLQVEDIAKAGKFVVIQSEMLGDDTINNWPIQERYSNVYLPLLKKASVVWDGQEQNRYRLKKMGIDPVHTQFGYLPQLEEIKHKKNKDIDFLYYGSITPHRKKMLDALKAKGGKIYVDFDSTAIYRNDLIARTRVNIAPVQSPELNHLTGTRILYLINNRSIVVVEHCKDQGYVEHCFPSANTDEWVDLCIETLKRPDLDKITQVYYERFKKLDLSHEVNKIVERL